MSQPGRRLRSNATPEQQEEAILDAASREFTEVGVRRANMDYVARQAGVSRSTLYRRFPNKDALLLGVGKVVFGDAMKRLGKATHGLDPHQAVVEAFVESSRMLNEIPLMRRLMLSESEIVDTLISLTAPSTKIFLEGSSTAVAATLRHAGSKKSDEDLGAVSEILVRLAASFFQTRSSRMVVTDEESVRVFAEKYLAPLVD